MITRGPDSTSDSAWPADALRVSRIDSSEDFDALQADWERLHALDDDASLFSGWSWNRLWWMHYGEEGSNRNDAPLQLCVLVVRMSGAVCAIAPFYITHSQRLRVFRFRTVRLLGSGGDTAPDDIGIIAMPTVREAATTRVCQHLIALSGIQRFELRDLRLDQGFGQQFVATACQAMLPPVFRTRTVRRVATLPASLDEWNDAQSRNARKQHRRRLNRLADIGSYEFHLCRSAEDVEEAHAALITLHHARRDTLGGSSSFASSSYIAFHRDLMQALLPRDELRLAVLRIDSRIVAVEYAFLCHGILAFFQTGFDPSIARASPGHLLMRYLIELAIEQGVTRMDLLKGEYDYKATYAEELRESESIDLIVAALPAFLMRCREMLFARR